MYNNLSKITIHGVNSSGEVFRPKNWPHRIACMFSPIIDGVCRYGADVGIGCDHNDVRYLYFINPTDDCIVYMKSFAKIHDLLIKVE